jgi:hypothetical protein
MDLDRNRNMRAIKYYNRPLKVKRWLNRNGIATFEDITNEQSYELLSYMMPKFKKRKKVVSTYVPYTSNQELSIWAKV